MGGHDQRRSRDCRSQHAARIIHTWYNGAPYMDERGRIYMLVRSDPASPRHVLAYGRRWLKRADGYYYRRYRVGPRSENHKVTEYLHITMHEREIGPVPEGFIVHHRDEEKSNNVPSNLEAMSRAEHNRIHTVGRINGEHQKEAVRRAAKEQWAAATYIECECVDCGAVFQSRARGKPRITCSLKCMERRRNRDPERRAASSQAARKARRLQLEGAGAA